ncbi:hypothetical protein ACFL3Q_08145, partial [Planctomycetota bacterium]
SIPPVNFAGLADGNPALQPLAAGQDGFQGPTSSAWQFAAVDQETAQGPGKSGQCIAFYDAVYEEILWCNSSAF